MKNKKLLKNKSGQVTLILVMVTMVAALGIAVASSSQSKINLRDTVYSTQSNQALSCAEGGVEQALIDNSILNDEPIPSPGYFSVTPAAASDGCDEYTTTVYNYPGDLDQSGSISADEQTIEIQNITENNIQEFRIAGIDSDGDDVCDGSGELPGYDQSGNQPITIQFRSHEVDGTGAPTQDVLVGFYQYTTDAVDRRIVLCDVASDDTSDLLEGTDFETASWNGDVCEYTIITMPTTDCFKRMLRVRPIYSDMYLRIDGFNGHAGYFIESVGTAGTVKRTIEVRTFYSQLPAGLDEAVVSFDSEAILN